MAYQLSFDVRHRFDSMEAGITVEAALRHGALTANCLAKIDTGAQLCLFERGVADILGLEAERGSPVHLSTLTGTLRAYGHDIILEVLGLTFETTAYFPESRDLRRNILGRQGFLQLVTFGLVDYD
ncbi:MAG: hypothetical protein ACREDR_43665, partial [Blastocatellia bacterium]